MFKRVLTLCVGVLLLSGSMLAQVDLTQAREKIDDEKYSDAENELKGYLGQKAKNEDEVYYYLGRLSFLQEDYEQARKYFDQGLVARRNSPLNLAGLAMIQFKEGKTADAKLAITTARDINKGKDKEVEYACAEALLEGGPEDIGEAKKVLYAMKDTDPKDPRPYIFLGTYYKKQGVPELAIDDLKKAIELKPDYYPAYVGLAELKFEEGKNTKENNAAIFNEGYNYAQKAIEMRPDKAPAYRVRGELYLLKKDYVKARDDYKTYVSKTDGDIKAQIRYASFLFLTESYQECFDELLRIEKSTNTNLMRRLKAMSLSKLGKQSEAKAAMDEYFANVKKEEYLIYEDYEVYADILREMKDLTKADEYYMKAILKNTDRAVVFEEISEKYMAVGKGYETAAKDAKAASTEALKKAQAFTDAYNALAKEGKNDEAKAQYSLREEQLAVSNAKKAEQAAKTDASVGVFALEAHYRQKALEMADPVGLQNYMKLATAQFKSKDYDGAEKSYQEVLKLKPDYTQPYTYLLQIGKIREDADTASIAWTMKPVAESVIAVFGEKAPAELDKTAKQLLLTSLEIMATYNFDPEGKAKNDCDAAKPWILKIYAVDPEYARIKQMADFCKVPQPER